LIVNHNVPIAALSKQSPAEPNETRNPASEAVLRPPTEPELRAAVRVMDQPSGSGVQRPSAITRASTTSPASWLAERDGERTTRSPARSPKPPTDHHVEISDIRVL
jgi:hypothetical protein